MALRLFTFIVAIVTLTFVSACVATGRSAGEPFVDDAEALQVEVDSAIAQDQFSESEASVRCSNDELVAQATLYVDQLGVPRKYVFEGGSSDSTHKALYYSDKAGSLRVIVGEMAAYNGTRRDFFLFYDAHGRQTRKEDRLLSGPGWASAPPTEVRDPAAELESVRNDERDLRSVCGE